jgi:hypothetical protein
MGILLIPRVLLYFSDSPKAIIDSEQVERFESKKSFEEKRLMQKSILSRPADLIQMNIC